MKQPKTFLSLFPALLLLALIASGCHGAATDPAGDASASGVASVQVVPARLMTIRNQIAMPGSFSPSQGASASITAATSAKISQILVKEGERVQKGQLLATLDTGTQQAQALAAQSAAVAAGSDAVAAKYKAKASSLTQNAALISAQSSLEAAKAQARSDIAIAKGNLISAESDWKKIEAGARPQELIQAHQATLAAEAAASKAKKDLARIQSLSKVGYASGLQLDDAIATEKSASAAYQTAMAQESLVKEGVRPIDRDAAKAKWDEAKLELENAKELGNQRIAQAQAALNQAKAGRLVVQQDASAALSAQTVYQQRQAEAAAASATANLSQIRAPFSGIIVRRFLNPGDLADTTNPIFQLVSTSKTDFVGALTATQAAEIKAGMAAAITPDGGQASDGTVLSVSTADPQTGVCRVRIACNTDAVAGATGNALVTIRTDRNVVAVPNSCLLQRDGDDVVFLASSGTAKQVKVNLGPTDGNNTEIKDGIKAGDQIIQLGQFELDDGAKIKIEPAKSTTGQNPSDQGS